MDSDHDKAGSWRDSYSPDVKCHGRGENCLSAEPRGCHSGEKKTTLLEEISQYWVPGPITKESISHVSVGVLWGWESHDSDMGQVGLYSTSHHSPAFWLHTLGCIWLRTLFVNEVQTFRIMSYGHESWDGCRSPVETRQQSGISEFVR